MKLKRLRQRLWQWLILYRPVPEHQARNREVKARADARLAARRAANRQREHDLKAVDAIVKRLGHVEYRRAFDEPNRHVGMRSPMRCVVDIDPFMFYSSPDETQKNIIAERVARQVERELQRVHVVEAIAVQERRDYQQQEYPRYK